jgi:hypothetical protein
MTERTDRRTALWGVAFIAFVVAAAAILIGAGEVPSDRAGIVSYYEDNDQLEIAGMLVGAACFFLLPFLGGLRALLRRGRDDGETLASVAFGAGLVFTALLFAVGACVSVVATAVDWQDNFRVDPNTAQVFDMLGIWFAMYAGTAGGVMVGASSLLALRTGALPKWLAIVGFVAAVLGFVGVLSWGLGFLAVLVWILLTTILLLVRSRSAERAVAAQAG